MANLVTLSRLVLLLFVAWLFYQPPSPLSFASFFLIIFIFVSDGLDGYIARKRNETKRNELVRRVVRHRGRSHHRCSRCGSSQPTLYAVAKAAAFAGLALQVPFPAILPDWWARVGWLLTALTYFFVYFSVVLCIARGLPVIAEFVHAQKHDIPKRPGRKQ